MLGPRISFCFRTLRSSSEAAGSECFSSVAVANSKRVWQSIAPWGLLTGGFFPGNEYLGRTFCNRQKNSSRLYGSPGRGPFFWERFCPAGIESTPVDYFRSPRSQAGGPGKSCIVRAAPALVTLAAFDHIANPAGRRFDQSRQAPESSAKCRRCLSPAAALSYQPFRMAGLLRG